MSTIIEQITIPVGATKQDLLQELMQERSHIEGFVVSLAHDLDNSRRDPEATFVKTIQSSLDWQGFVIPDGATAATLADEIRDAIAADTCYDSEYDMARRASFAVISRHFGY